MPTLSEMIAEFASHPVTWVRCATCGWIDVESVRVTETVDGVVGFYCPACERSGSSETRGGEYPGEVPGQNLEGIR